MFLIDYVAILHQSHLVFAEHVLCDIRWGTATSTWPRLMCRSRLWAFHEEAPM